MAYISATLYYWLASAAFYHWLAEPIFAYLVLTVFDALFRRNNNGHDDAAAWIRLLIAYEIVFNWLGGSRTVAILALLHAVDALRNRRANLR